MAGAPYCSRSRSGKVSACCAAELETADPPQQIFARLLAVLEHDRFYEVAEARASSPAEAATGAVLELAVFRCEPLPNTSTVGSTNAPTPNSRTTVLRVVVPFGTKPSDASDPNVARLLEDVTRAIYQSPWEAGDVY